MTRTYKFNRSTRTPLISGSVFGNTLSSRVRLVFDTGAAITQLSTRIVEGLGYSARDGVNAAVMTGPTGPLETGYSLHVRKLSVLGKTFSLPLVAAFDFDHLDKAKIDGLLGFDLIKEFHLELNGRDGELIVFE